MDIRDQSAVIDFLKHPESYGKTGQVKVIETHISLVFLIDDRAFKLKRAVKLPYVDFSTYERRLTLSLREVELNCRATPDLYLGIRRITREADGSLTFDGKGDAIDVVVVMLRFSQHDLFDRMADEGRLTASMLEETAGIIARFHASASVVHDGSGSANIAAVLDINDAGFATSHLFRGPELADLSERFKTAWNTHIRLLDERERAGKVRLCHGDLHLRNIYESSKGPRLFDCIDFNDQIATVDVLYDLAFLLMDLWHRGFPQLASLVANRYLDATGDDGGVALLPFFMAVRAAVRAHVTGTQIEEMADPGGKMAASARSYFDFAKDLLRPSAARLIAIGGLSGSGKSTLAEALAPRTGIPPGARVLESDRIRKGMFAIEASGTLPAEAYNSDVSRRVYETMLQKAQAVLERGGTAIVNAVFDRTEDRDAAQQLATDLGVDFRGIWLEANPDTLRRRIETRPKGASDATIDVLNSQLSRNTGTIDWHRFDSTQPVSALVARAEGLLSANAG